LDQCILIVDDFEPTRKALRSFFEKETSFAVCEAEDGCEALTKAENVKPRLIVLDMSMARMNGIQAAPILKKALPHTPIILFTSHFAAVEGFEEKIEGVDAVLPKDGDLSNLLAHVETLIHSSGRTNVVS
jgi:two-component system, OmpR family, response regulator